MTGLNVWIIGKKYWILIWYGILILGVTGFFSALYWGRRTHWRNLDEMLRAAGTAFVSAGMLLVLYGIGDTAAQILLLFALVGFVLAFILGRRPGALTIKRDPADDDEDEDPEEVPPPAGDEDKTP